MTAFEKRIEGQRAMKIWYDASLAFDGFQVRYPDFNSLVREIDASSPKFMEFMGGWVEGFSAGEIESKMETLGEKMQGRLPAKLSDFGRAFVTGEIPTLSNWEFTKEVVSAAPAEFGKQVLAAGEGIGEVLKATGFLLPIAVAVAVGFVIFQKGKSLS